MPLFFFLMIRLSQSSTLFPYTTLFRSLEFARSLPDKSLGSHRALVYETVFALLYGLGLRVGDRKSTRLNSSHEWISYAVFCLKKKNIITQKVRLRQKSHLITKSHKLTV